MEENELQNDGTTEQPSSEEKVEAVKKTVRKKKTVPKTESVETPTNSGESIPSVKSTETVSDSNEKVPEIISDETSIEMPAVESEADEIPLENTKSDQPIAEEKDNTTYVNERIEKLISLKEQKEFSDFWFYAKEMNTTIFTLRGVSKEDRFKFKERINELCEEVKKLQDEQKAKIGKTSKLKLEQIQTMLAEALAFGEAPEEVEKSFQKIDAANKFFRDGIVTSEDGESSADMSRGDRENAKEQIRKAKDLVLDRKRAIREANMKLVSDKLSHINDEFLDKAPRKVFDAVKKLREEMKTLVLGYDQIKEIDSVIDIMWKKALEKLNAGRSHDSQKKISDLEFNMRKKEQFIQTLEKEIKELTVKWSNVSNDFFKNRVNEWMEEKKEKIGQTKKEIESIKEKVSFLNEQLKRK